MEATGHPWVDFVNYHNIEDSRVTKAGLVSDFNTFMGYVAEDFNNPNMQWASVCTDLEACLETAKRLRDGRYKEAIDGNV